MKLDVYINYPGNCEQAFNFYAQQLGGKITLMTVHQQAPPNFPKEWAKPILHAIIEIGGTTVRGADIPGVETMRSAYLTLNLESAEKAEEVYTILSQGGEIFMPLAQTSWANRFAMLRDQFGVSWMLLNQE